MVIKKMLIDRQTVCKNRLFIKSEIGMTCRTRRPHAILRRKNNKSARQKAEGCP